MEWMPWYMNQDLKVFLHFHASPISRLESNESDEGIGYPKYNRCETPYFSAGFVASSCRQKKQSSKTRIVQSALVGHLCKSSLILYFSCTSTRRWTPYCMLPYNSKKVLEAATPKNGSTSFSVLSGQDRPIRWAASSIAKYATIVTILRQEAYVLLLLSNSWVQET